MYYDRKKKRTVNYGEHKQGMVEFLYKTIPGRIMLKTCLARPWFSKLAGVYYNSKLSQKDIAPFISSNYVNMYGSTVADYNTFNEFFTRKNTKLVVDENREHLIAVADSKLSCYDIDDNLVLHIKNSTYSVADLIGSKQLAKSFAGGKCLVFRLSVNDNHRYIYCDSGNCAARKVIKGELHTVRAISEKYNVFSRNCREVMLLDMDNLGRVGWIEVGALLVGKIINHKKPSFVRGEEKGYFEFGGSTIILLVKKEIEIDEDIVRANAEGLEAQVMAGERIGIICSKD